MQVHKAGFFHRLQTDLGKEKERGKVRGKGNGKGCSCKCAKLACSTGWRRRGGKGKERGKGRRKGKANRGCGTAEWRILHLHKLHSRVSY